MPEPVSLDSLFCPRAVAIVGASDNMAKMSAKIVHILRKFGFPGAIATINPSRDSVFGITCYPSIGAVPFPLDVAFLYIPKKSIASTVDECIASGVRNLVILSGGFAEVGADGRAEQDAIVGRLRQAGIRLLGPNCAGLASFHDRFVTYATSSLVQLPSVKVGDISFVSQSGGVGNIVFNLLQARKVGIAKLISTGNEADIGAQDCVRQLVFDADTETILLYTESYGNLPALATEIRNAVRAGKRVAVLRTGRTAVGRRAAASHTGALAGEARVVDGALRQAGATLVEDMDQLVDFAVMVRRRAYPRGNRIGIYTILGGGAPLMSDLALEHGLAVPPLAKSTVDGLRGILAPNSAFGNPIDPTADIHLARERFPASASLVADDPNTDLYVVLPAVGEAGRALELASDLVDLARRHPKPVAVVWPGDSNLHAAWERLDEQGVPLFRSANACVRAIAGALQSRCAAERLASAESRQYFTPTNQQQEELDSRLRPLQPGNLSEFDSKRLLSAFGLPSTREVEVEHPGEARLAASRMGFPVALKASSPDLPHKSDAGFVHLNVGGAEEVETIAAAMFERMRKTGSRRPRMLVAEMLPRSPELIVGSRRVVGGAVSVMLGVGGVGVELIDDAVAALAPLSAADARALIASLKSQRLLDGWRGLPPVPRLELAAFLMRFSRLACLARDRVREIDINPLMVRDGALLAADALVVVDPVQGTV